MSLSFSKLLHSLRHSTNISKVKLLHSKSVTSGFQSDVTTNNHLLSLYAKCGFLDDARHLFDQMPNKNVISWSTLISAYSNSGRVVESIAIFRSMVSCGFAPNDFSYVGVISACATIKALRIGKEIHASIYRVEVGVLSSFVCNSLLNLYAKCGMIKMARKVFDGIVIPSLVSWGSIISGYCQCGKSEEALRIFLRARREGVEVNEFFISSVLGACGNIEDLKVALQVHCLIVKSGIGSDRYVESGLVGMYVKRRKMWLADRAFFEMDEPGLATWAALIAGFAQQGQSKKAMDLFCKFRLAGLRPNEHIFPTVLVACSDASMVKEGRQIHSLILKMGYMMASHVVNSVLDFYARCGLIDESSKVFMEMEDRDTVTWNALIARHIENGDPIGATDFLKRMLVEGKDPNLYTYSSILSLCADLPAIGWGQQTHTRIIKPGFDTNVVVGSALIDMYAKCGRLNDAQNVFNRLPSKNVVSWNGMLVGYAQHGFGKEALEIYDMMERENIERNEVTFIGVLSACGHIGLVNQGQYYFDIMKALGITPRLDHFACMVDLFARSGQIERAYELIKSMPVKPNKVIWRSLLAGCRIHRDRGLGILAAQQILDIDPEDTAGVLMLSSIYANSGVSEERTEVRKSEKIGRKKFPGCSWIEVKNKNHCFFVGDVGPNYGDEIHEALNLLAVQMTDLGYFFEG